MIRIGLGWNIVIDMNIPLLFLIYRGTTTKARSTPQW
jgi:hypothetical protein